MNKQKHYYSNCNQTFYVWIFPEGKIKYKQRWSLIWRACACVIQKKMSWNIMSKAKHNFDILVRLLGLSYCLTWNSLLIEQSNDPSEWLHQVKGPPDLIKTLALVQIGRP